MILEKMQYLCICMVNVQEKNDKGMCYGKKRVNRRMIVLRGDYIYRYQKSISKNIEVEYKLRKNVKVNIDEIQK